MFVFLFRLIGWAGLFFSGSYLARHLIPIHGVWVPYAVGLGFIFLVEYVIFALKNTPSQKRMGLAFGFLASVLVASLAAVPMAVIPLDHAGKLALTSFVFLVIIYVGTLIGYYNPDSFNPYNIIEMIKSSKYGKNYKILDTSVIIDGRISDLVETGFIEGTLVVPRFVLRELQYIADSADPVRRNRGRRGLEMLQKMQKKSNIDMAIMEVDFPNVKEVDLKLIELAKQINGKIITNDYNLNKVAQLHNVKVLNINELATSLKPVVLPGETMNVYILKEGKEYNQGVAYLEDGTMVVVDNARKMIGKNIEITVTSVLQTSMGKMIFGKYEKNNERA